MRLTRLATVTVTAVTAVVVLSPPALAAASPTVGAVNSFAVVQGTTAPTGDLTVTEAAAGQLPVGDKITFKFQDAASGATIHFGTAGTVGGSNGLAGTVKITSSSTTPAPLLDQMEVTITSASSGSFPGVLTLSNLAPALDPTAATGALKVTVTDAPPSAPALLSAAQTSDANVVGAAVAKAGYSAQTNPTILATGTGQSVSNVVVTEPAKIFFKTGDVITFFLRDVNGSQDTVGLAGTPSAGGGSMQVSVHGANTDAVQVNDTSFKVKVDAQDPSNGSTSAITITNLVVNTAQAPLGAVTLSAVLTTGAGTELIVPGRVVIAGVGGNTNTAAAGLPSVAIGATGQPAANVTVSAAAGSLLNGDTLSLTIQEAGVTFTGAALPQATITNGDLVPTQSLPTLDGTGKTVTWTVKTGNARSTTMVVGPIQYDVAGSAVAGDHVTLLAAGNQSSSFNSQNVDNAVIVGTHPVARFTTKPSDLTPIAGVPWKGADVTVTETSVGAMPVGSSIVLVTPYASQIAAYRTTYASIPSATVNSGGLVLGAAVVNSSAMVVQTAAGPITAPAQTVVSFPVTTASTSPATVTISNLVYNLGSLVPPGALVGTGAVVASGGGSALDGEQYVDLSSTRGLGSTSSSQPPVVLFTQQPPALTNSRSATFAWYSNPTGANFSCSYDNVNFGVCVSPITLTGVPNGSHTFTVTATLNNQTSTPVSVTWTVNNTPPTATTPPTVALNGAFVVTFSKPVLGAGTITWADALTSTAVPGTLTCANGTTPTPCNAGSGVTTATFTPASPLVPGATYRTTLTGISDTFGTPMASTPLSTRASTTEQETSLAAVVAWRTVPTSSASGGSYGVDHQAGALTTFTFTGTSVAWYTVKGPSFGTAGVYLDGALKKTYNGYATAVGYNVLGYSVGSLSNAKHTLVIKVNGARGSTAGTGTFVAVDRFTVGSTTTQQNGAGVRSTWRRVATTAANGGGYSIDDLAGASHTMAFVGTGIKWYAVGAPSMGRANVYVDNVLKGTIDLFASTTTYNKVAYTLTGLTLGKHTIRIVVLGTHRTGATGSNVTVDRLAIT